MTGRCGGASCRKLLWFSGRLVPGVDPENAENADEQMNFGFSTGDEAIPAPYFYITAYPVPEKLKAAPLPVDAAWHTQGWQGAILMYDSLVAAENAGQKLLGFLRTVHQAASSLMKQVINPGTQAAAGRQSGVQTST